MSTTPPTPRPASTVLLLRDSRRAEREIEVFMMVRHYQIEFVSGALVFPGGSVDANDREIITHPELYSGNEGFDPQSLSFRIGGIRETFEESGILLARQRGSKELIDAKRAGDPNSQPDSQVEERPPQEEPHDLARFGTQRRTHTDLTSPLRHRIRRHGVQADRREHQRDEREYREHAAEDTKRPPLLCQILVHRPDVEER